MIFHLPGLRAATCYKPGWVDALIAAGRADEATGMLTVSDDAYDRVLADFEGNPKRSGLDPLVAAAIARQQAGCKGCGDSPLEGI